jgi:hypothetical protein
LIFFVNDRLRNDNSGLPKENIAGKTNAIYDLMHYYGEKTHDTEKGGNLLHKLLLENRIQIVKTTDIADFPTFDAVEIKSDAQEIQTEKNPAMSAS